jgi:predicted metal-dependent hydrolase
MPKDPRNYKIEDIEFKIIYSGRRTIGISVLPDSSVIVRAPYLTPVKSIDRLVREKYGWVLKHRDNYRQLNNTSLIKSYATGETHLFRGNEYILKVEKSEKSYVCFCDNKIEIGAEDPDNAAIIKKLLYKGYKDQAMVHFPELLTRVLKQHEKQMFNPSGLVIRTMKRRWGSCSNRGLITLSTELIKLSDLYIEYVIAHELCHLKHQNHGAGYYKLLSEVYPEWKTVRKELRKYIR